MNFDHLVDDFSRRRLRAGLSPATEHTYRGAFLDLRRSLEAQGVDPDRLSDWTPNHIEAWQDGQVDRLKPASRSMRATAVRQLIEWAERQDLPVKRDLWRAVTTIRVRRGQPRPLSEDDLRKLLAYLARKWPGAVDRVALRDRAFILYAIGSAGRLSELLQVRRDEYQSAVVVRKGGGEGTLMIPAVVVAAVEAYLATRHDDLPWLWIGLGHNGLSSGRLSAEGVRHICKKLSVKAGLSHSFAPHALRHTSATALLDAGVQEAVIANHLGHHGLGTLANYAEVRPKRRAEALSAMQEALGGQAATAGPIRPKPAPTGPVEVKPPSREKFLDELVSRLVETVEKLESRVEQLADAVGIDEGDWTFTEEKKRCEQEHRRPFDWDSLAPEAS